MGPKDIYLILYNAACCAGWALVWKNAVSSLAKNLGGGETELQDVDDGTNAIVSTVMSPRDALASVYAECDPDLLFVTQMVAIMEIVHAMLRLVRSPVMVTGMQVMSRVVAVLAVHYSLDAQSTYQI